MSIPAVTGAAGFYPLSGKGLRPPSDQPFYWHPATRASMGAVQIQRTLARELGMSMLPHGAYKGGVYGAGTLEMQPRIGDALAWLCYAFGGTVTSTGSGPYVHIFGRNDDTTPTKYMAFRRMIPVTGGSWFGETLWDGRVMGLTFNAAAGNVLTAGVNMQALEPVANAAPSGAGWQPTSDNGGYDPGDRVPIATRSLVEMPDGTALTTFRNLQIQMAMGAPNPEAEMVLGSYYPHDITPLTRDITITGQFFWQNATLYSQMFYGGGSTWSYQVWTGGQPFDVQFETSNPVLASNSMTALLGFQAQKVIWACQPVDLVAGDVVVMDLIGTVVNNTTWEDWRLYMRNDTAAYAWPT